MPESIKHLKKLWEDEKEEYKSKETGFGVQNFVKKVLEAEDVFGLKEGKLKTPIEKRKNEFIYEEPTKSGRHVDFVIYINSEIIIPVEVESFTHIERGEKQLQNYQIDLEKKYGILTDGFTWRFYNNENIEQEFKLEEIFNEPSKFSTFWNEYIKPIHYYSTFFEERVIIKKQLPVESNKESFFDDTTFLIRNIKNKLQIEGYFQKLQRKEKNKKATQLAYSYLIQFILYKTLVDNEFSEFLDEYKKNLNLLSKYVKEDRYRDIFSIIGGISQKISENVYRPFHKEQDIVEEKIKSITYKPELKLSEISLWLDIFVYVKKYNFRNIKNEIFGFVYENYLKELFEEGKKGQYFTDSSVVNFMINLIEYTSDKIKEKLNKDEKDKLSIIDPACGSGTFLYTAVNNIVNSISDGLEASKKIEELVSENIFGLDIEEFPLYLAEMSILMRLLPIIISKKYNNPFDKKIKLFLTEDSIAEFMDLGMNSKDSDSKKEQINLQYFTQPEFQSFMRDKNDLDEMKQSLQSHYKIPRRRFDYVVANPPYIDYNTCSKQKIAITQLIQNKIVQMSNIYGVNLNTVPGIIKAYAPKPNLYAFFIALGLALLKNHGKLCYIIPQTILTSTDLDVLRYHLSKFVTLRKIFIFRGNLFVERGLGQSNIVPTSSLIFLAEKEKPTENNVVEIINYRGRDKEISEVFGDIISNKNIDKREVSQKELLERLLNWNFLKWNPLFSDFYAKYIENTESVDIYREYDSSKSRFGDIFQFDKGLVFAKNKIEDERNIQSSSNYYHLIKTNKNKYEIGISDKVINKKFFRFPKGSQGIEVYDRKYKIIWRYMNPERFYFTDKKVMFNFNYILISSNNKEEMLYLFSLINSSIIRLVLSNLLSSESEKDLLLGIKAIKNYFRVPKITKGNQEIKQEIIKKTEELLSLEGKKLRDFVNFSDILMQKADIVKIEKGYLIIIKADKKIEKKITGNTKWISHAIDKEFSDINEIDLSNLKELQIIDLDKQRELKEYIDNLVFSLYFNLDVNKFLEDSRKIANICEKNKYYRLFSK